MKKILTYILFAQLIFLSCKKSEVEPIFEESANKRVTTVLDSYKKQLVSVYTYKISMHTALFCYLIQIAT